LAHCRRAAISARCPRHSADSAERPSLRVGAIPPITGIISLDGKPRRYGTLAIAVGAAVLIVAFGVPLLADYLVTERLVGLY
jgi:hypothetical protein